VPSARTDVPGWGQVQDGTANYAVAGGTADALTLALTPAITAYAAGQVLTARLTATNTSTTPTVAVSGLPAKTITRLGGSAIAIGDLVSGATVQFAYNAATDKFEIVSPLAASTGTGAAVRATSPALTTPNIGAATATSLTFASETMSTYDEGTFTPDPLFGGGNAGLTTSLNQGYYTKIGNVVAVSVEVTLSAEGTSNGAFTIGNLPFTTKSGPLQSLAVGGFGGAVLTASNTDIQAVLSPDSRVLNWFAYNPNTGDRTQIDRTMTTNSSLFKAAGTYLASTS
jgi:hypothetical protein